MAHVWGEVVKGMKAFIPIGRDQACSEEAHRTGRGGTATFRAEPNGAAPER